MKEQQKMISVPTVLLILGFFFFQQNFFVISCFFLFQDDPIELPVQTNKNFDT